MSARRMWQLLEPVHAVTYFADAAREPVLALGVTGFWNSYVVARAAPLGPVGPAVVTAAFFGFHPKRAAAVLPEVWAKVSPADVLQARSDGAVEVLRRHGQDVGEVADLLWRAAQHADCAGRVLGAANQAVPLPDDPFARLWQATTTLREHRGDGHIASLVAHGIGPIEAMALKVAAGESQARDLQLGRGWDETAWAAAEARLEERGWVEGGVLTEDGRETRESVEGVTDAEAEQPWTALNVDEVARAADLLAPLTQAIWASGIVPPSNPVGVTET
jgi:hypothetical protein